VNLLYYCVVMVVYEVMCSWGVWQMHFALLVLLWLLQGCLLGIWVDVDCLVCLVSVGCGWLVFSICVGSLQVC